jgi:hypothetical protein
MAYLVDGQTMANRFTGEQHTIGVRVGTFPGMAEEQVFRIVWVAANHGAGPAVVKNADREVYYVGKPSL